MRETFADLPEACDSDTSDIARRCAFPGRRSAIRSCRASTPAPAAARRRSWPTRRARGSSARLDGPPVPLAEPEEVYWARLEREIGVITQMGFPGYFLIVLGLHQMGQGPRRPRRPGPRARAPARLVAWALSITGLDPLTLRTAVRALPEIPERVSMPRLRHRLLPGPPRRGDRLRPASKLQRGPGRPDHHLRHAAGPRRAARRRPGDAAAARAMVDRLAKMVPNNPANPGDPGPGHRHRTAAETGGQGRGPAVAWAARGGAEVGGTVPQRLDPRRRAW